MRVLILAIGLFFCFFPYTQIIELDSYNQPYALLFCALAALMSFDRLAREFPRRDMRLLFLFAMLGLVTFFITCMPDPNPIELKSLLSYLSPPIFCLAGFAIARTAPRLAYRIAVAAAVTWMFVGVTQTLVSPSFATQFVGQWEDAAVVVVQSGRGVLGLAPEPTHYGFHMLVIATSLVVLGQGRLTLPALCVLTSIFVARSSSAMLAMILGTMLYLAIYTRWARILLLATVPAYFALGAIVRSGALPDSVRLFQILTLLYEHPMILIAADASVNNRIGGIIVGFQEIWRNMLMPYGLSNDAWMASIGQIMARNSWLIGISTSGIPSGLLIIVYQTGILGLLLLIGMFRRMFARHRWRHESWFVCVLLFVFMSQYSISTPGFGLAYGLLLARFARRPAATKRRPVPAPASPLPTGLAAVAT